MELDIERKDMAQYAILAVVFFMLILFVSSLTLDKKIDAQYSQFYFIHSVLTLVSVPIFVVFNWKLGESIQIPKYIKAIVFVGFTVFIISISLPGVQQAINYADCSGDVCVSRPIINIPKAVKEPFAIDPTTETATRSLIPAVTEDWNYLFAFPLFIIVILIFISEKFTSGLTIPQFLSFALIACLISASVFTVSHAPAYGNNQPAYTGAFVYSFGQSMTYVTTGWFVPAAHFFHNEIVGYSQSTSLSIGGSAFI